MIVFIIVVSVLIAAGSLAYALLNFGSAYDVDMGIDSEDKDDDK